MWSFVGFCLLLVVALWIGQFVLSLILGIIGLTFAAIIGLGRVIVDFIKGDK